MIKEYKGRRILSLLMIVVMTICMLLPAGCQKQTKTKLEEMQAWIRIHSHRQIWIRCKRS